MRKYAYNKLNKKGIPSLVIRGWYMRNNRDRYAHVYIFLIRRQKENFLKKYLSVFPSVLLRLSVSKTYAHLNSWTGEDNWVRFFFVWKVYTGSRNCPNFDPNARRLAKLEPNEIFNDFSISREPFDENNTKTDWTRLHEDFRSWSRMKVLLAISWSSNE